MIGTVWAYWMLHDPAARQGPRIDWWGNLTFGVGLTVLLVGDTYGIRPYGGHSQGWTNPFVIACLVGVAVLCVFCFVDTRVGEPMFHLRAFRIRAFTPETRRAACAQRPAAGCSSC